MLTFIGDHFIYLVLAAITTFVVVLAVVCVLEAAAGKRSQTH